MSDLLVGASITFVSMFVGWSVGRVDRASEEGRSIGQRKPFRPFPPGGETYRVSPKLKIAPIPPQKDSINREDEKKMNESKVKYMDGICWTSVEDHYKWLGELLQKKKHMNPDEYREVLLKSISGSMTMKR